MSDPIREHLKRIMEYKRPEVRWCEPWVEVDCPLPCGGTIYVDKVNEDYIEESGLNRDFVEGDNWLHDQRQKDHPPYVPDHHIFLSTGVFKMGWKKVMKTFTHELTELIFESKGLPYEEAHPIANEVETEIGSEIKAEDDNAP